MSTLNAIDFAKYLKGPVDVHARVRPPVEFAAQLEALYNTEAHPVGGLLPWAKTHEWIRLRPGELSIWSGINGSGKSLLCGQALFECMRQGERVCIASMEMPAAQTLKRLVQQASGMEHPSEAYRAAFLDWCSGKLWLYDQLNMVSGKQMIALARYSRQELGVTHMLIDSLMKCGISATDIDSQKMFVGELCAHAMDTQMHVHLVTHSKKTDKSSDRMDKFSVSGAAAITDQADNVFLVTRNKANELARQMGKDVPASSADVILECDKQRHGVFGGERAYRLWVDEYAMGFVDKPHTRVSPLVLKLKPDEGVPF